MASVASWTDTAVLNFSSQESTRALLDFYILCSSIQLGAQSPTVLLIRLNASKPFPTPIPIIARLSLSLRQRYLTA